MKKPADAIKKHSKEKMIILAYIIFVAIVIILNVHFSNTSPTYKKSRIIEEWKSSEIKDIKEYDAAVDQAMADASLSSLRGNTTEEIISYYHSYNQSDENFVCRHRSARIVGEYLLLNSNTTEEICIVNGFLYGTRGMTLWPSDEHTGSGHSWIRYKDKDYDYLIEGEDYHVKIPLVQRCYSAWGQGPSRLNGTGFEKLYTIYEEVVLNMTDRSVIGWQPFTPSKKS